MSILRWIPREYGADAFLGDFAGGDGVRFSMEFQATCYRRGRWKLLIEIEDPHRHWGCFDDQDQPLRYYHSLERLKEEAEAIAEVLILDYQRKSGKVLA